jgi:hypothetical protein
MNRIRHTISAACCALSLAACSGENEPADDAQDVPDVVAQAAEVARAISQHPEAADSILAAHDLSRAQFDSLMFEIAMAPELTAAFEEARRR